MKKTVVRVALVAVVAVLVCTCLIACEGESAYDIAVRNGFVGTEQEWLNSLYGRNGMDGLDASILDIYDIFDVYKIDNPDATFEEFLYSFLTIEYYDSAYASAIAMRSVVSISSRFQTTSIVMGRPTTVPKFAGGSGVVYKLDGDWFYILTNYHVIYDSQSVTENCISDQILVYSYAATDDVEAEFIGGSASKDIAVIRVLANQMPEYIQAAKQSKTAPSAGMQVIAVGNPLSGGIAATAGIVSVDSEYIEMDALEGSGTVTMRVVRTDTPINQGNSGGGLFNMRGELMGIVNAKTVSNTVENVGYAIPFDVASGVAECVINNNSQKAVLGVTVEVIDTSARYNSAQNTIEVINVIVVQSLEAGALVENVLQIGDQLVSADLNGNDTLMITRLFQLSDYLHKARVGDVLNLTVLRDGESVTLPVTITTDCLRAV